LLAPAGTPDAMINALNARITKILDRPDVQERLRTMALDAASGTPEAAAAHMTAEADKWTKVVRDAGLKLECTEGRESRSRKTTRDLAVTPWLRA
jgi:tripartite-type tricarboxylate transporter receptor subunit TctC